MCDCRVCTDHRRWTAAINPKTKKAKAAFDEILSRLEAAETDATYWKLKHEGKWPSLHGPERDYTLQVSKLDELGRIAITSGDEDLVGLVVYAEPAAAFADVDLSVKTLRRLDNSTSEAP